MNETETRLADQNRGPSRFPHWHDGAEWVKRTTMTRSRFLAMTAEGFADWVRANYNSDDVKGFFYGMRWPEGYRYCLDRDYTILTAYRGMAKHRDSWPTPLLDTDD